MSFVHYDVYSARTGYEIPTGIFLRYDAHSAVTANEFLSRDWTQVQGYFNAWQRATLLITPATGKRVVSATIKVMAGDLEDSAYATDIKLQGGNILTGWTPARKDVMDAAGLGAPFL